MNKLKSIWQIEDLRKKILFTLLLILVFRLGCSIPVPFVSNTALDSMFSNDSIFGYMNMLSGGALSRCRKHEVCSTASPGLVKVCELNRMNIVR